MSLPTIDFTELVNMKFKIEYKAVFNMNVRSKEVVDELAEKIEAITNISANTDDIDVIEKEPQFVEDATVMTESSIADIIDSFVKMRPGEALDDFDSSSLSRMLITLNQLVKIKVQDGALLEFSPEEIMQPSRPFFMEKAYVPPMQENGLSVLYQSSPDAVEYASGASQSMVYNNDPMMSAVNQNHLGKKNEEKKGY